MPERELRACRILVVEDEYILADELQTELEDAEAIVLGPTGTLKDALALVTSEPHIDGAILDVNLRGEMAYPLADQLIERGVPLVFTTGYDEDVIPSRFADVVRCEKPVNMRRVAQAIGRVIHA